MSDAIYSTMVRDGKITLFVEVIEHKDKHYLQIVESRLKNDGSTIKTTITVRNPATCEHLKAAIGEAVTVIGSNMKP